MERPYVENVLKKTKNTLWTCKRMVGTNLPVLRNQEPTRPICPLNIEIMEVAYRLLQIEIDRNRSTCAYS